ncbi:ATPase [Bacteroides sp. OttesenSCG-928-E20]|nr:ATPase [Bacteroides sp. OttesenSCG-928-N06]MDL2299413.1 ATPase [Bacteroides sp. OttesenSCG-928-E20]MDL2304178.1 ATPase [Bacteroides sp. OttesenSCG-928-D19]
MKLIADSGSSKTRWVLSEKGRVVKTFKTGGLNPYFQTPEEAAETIKNEVLPLLGDEDIRAIHFYGAGCTPEKKKLVRGILKGFFPETRVITVESDVMGAARGLCGKRPGIACILGTGSNSCFYDGKNIVQNVSPLGYILGDEGSGAVLGRTLVGHLLKNQLPEGLKEEFLAKYDLTTPQIIERVYRQPFANRFLASFSPFLLQHINTPQVRQLVLDSFKDFITRNVKQYNYQEYPIYFTGSVSYYYHQVLFEAASHSGIVISSIIKSPIDGLIAYHA